MGENPGDALRRWKTYRPIIGLEKGATNTCGQRGTYCDPGRGTGRGPAREKQKPGSCRQRGDLNGVAEVLQTHDEASGVDGFGPLVEVVRAEIAIELTADQHVVDAGQDRGGERAERLFGAAAGAQAVELGLEIAGLLAGGGRGALHEGGLEPRGPLAHPSRSALAGALVVFRAQAGPRDQVAGGRQAADVAADFGQDDASAQFVDAGNGGQETDGGAKGLDIGVDLLIDLIDRRVDGV